MGTKTFLPHRIAASIFFGLMISDGHLGRLKGNKGRVAIELKKNDSKILHKLQSYIIPYSSIRDDLLICVHRRNIFSSRSRDSFSEKSTGYLTPGPSVGEVGIVFRYGGIFSTRDRKHCRARSVYSI